MSGGFAFPPPPPPPPRPSTGDRDQQRYDTQSSGRGRGRGRGGSRGGNRGENRGGSRGGHHNDFTQRPGNSPPRTVAGHKRKLDVLRGPQPEQVKKPGPQTAPAVPSFGTQILPTKPTAAPTKATPTSRGLGLVPLPDGATYDDSDSEDDNDLDEEAMFAGLSNQLTFEHNGVFVSLKSQADLMAWQKDRRTNFPTNTRMAVKYEEKRRIGEERKRLLSATEVLQSSSGSRRSTGKGKPAAAPRRGSERTVGPEGDPPFKAVEPLVIAPPSGEIQTIKKTNEQAERLAELRRKVAESEARNRAAKGRLQNTEEKAAAPTAIETEVENQSSAPISGSLVGQPNELVRDGDAQSSKESPSDSSSEESSEVSSDSESDDSAPEEVASKPPLPASNGYEAPLCKYFNASGHCRNGNDCKFRHEWRPHHKEASDRVEGQDQARRERRKKIEKDGKGKQMGRKTIFERLVEQEQDEQDRLALQVIKYLGKAGFFVGEEDGKQT